MLSQLQDAVDDRENNTTNSDDNTAESSNQGSGNSTSSSTTTTANTATTANRKNASGDLIDTLESGLAVMPRFALLVNQLTAGVAADVTGMCEHPIESRQLWSIFEQIGVKPEDDAKRWDSEEAGDNFVRGGVTLRVRCAFLTESRTLGFHAFAPLEALPCVCPMTFLVEGSLLLPVGNVISVQTLKVGEDNMLAGVHVLERLVQCDITLAEVLHRRDSKLWSKREDREEEDDAFETPRFIISNGKRVRCAFFGRNLHSRMPFVLMPARLKRTCV
jgi:hypothetical protein